jgi:hypothetical protein
VKGPGCVYEGARVRDTGKRSDRSWTGIRGRRMNGERWERRNVGYLICEITNNIIVVGGFMVGLPAT